VRTRYALAGAAPEGDNCERDDRARAAHAVHKEAGVQCAKSLFATHVTISLVFARVRPEVIARQLPRRSPARAIKPDVFTRLYAKQASACCSLCGDAISRVDFFIMRVKACTVGAMLAVQPGEIPQLNQNDAAKHYGIFCQPATRRLSRAHSAHRGVAKHLHPRRCWASAMPAASEAACWRCWARGGKVKWQARSARKVC